MRCLIGGGSGFVGSALAKALRARGDEVVLVSRKGGPGRITWTEIKEQGLPSCDAVINLAGVNIFSLWPWTQSFRDSLLQSRVKTNTTLSKAILASQQPPKVFVSASGIGYYQGESRAGGKQLTEGDEGGQGFFPDLVRQWEASAREAERKCRVVNIRKGVVLGRDGGAFYPMKLAFSLGLGGRVGSGEQPFPWIHLEDAVSLYLFAVDSDKLRGPVNGVAPQISSNAEFTRALARAVRMPAIIRAPAFALNLALGADRAAVLLKGQPAIPKAALDAGFQFKFPRLEPALADLTRKA